METKKTRLKRIPQYGSFTDEKFADNVGLLLRDTLAAKETRTRIAYHSLSGLLEYREFMRYMHWYVWQAHPETVGTGGNWFDTTCLVHGVSDNGTDWYDVRISFLKKLKRLYMNVKLN